MTHHQDIGARGEALAADYLRQVGLEVVDRNWRSRRGELDILAHDGGTDVAVEVKARTSHRYGHGAEAVAGAKLVRLHRLAWEWQRRHGRRGADLRVDVVAIVFDADGYRLDHYRGVGA
ncbi:YraN family protein [Zhihengliuella sp.]|uniref:YraN family protein n=1 Tax=Zhihengliuella sp. TaxID=1954483 RepID=UPI0028127C49|nr:YraN family protein [Zhihengliuella sp.]